MLINQILYAFMVFGICLGGIGAVIAFIAARNMHGAKSGKDIETLE